MCWCHWPKILDPFVPFNSCSQNSKPSRHLISSRTCLQIYSPSESLRNLRHLRQNSAPNDRSAPSNASALKKQEIKDDCFRIIVTVNKVGVNQLNAWMISRKKREKSAFWHIAAIPNIPEPCFFSQLDSISPLTIGHWSNWSKKDIIQFNTFEL